MMEVRVLRYFLTVVREESITKAAEVLHITQPTLSRQLAQFEEEVGVRLFNRGTRKIVLTNEGLLLRRRAEEIVDLIDKTERELLEQDELVDGTVTIGAGELASAQILAELIKSTGDRFPLMRYEILTASADLTKERMDKGLTDIGLLLEPIDIEKYEFVRLKVKERWAVLLQADDPLAPQEYVRREELMDAPLIIPMRGNVQNELLNWFGPSLDRRNIVMTSSMSTNASVMVENGIGRAIIIEGGRPYLDRERLVCRLLFPELSATSVLAWKRGQPFCPAADKFIEHIKKTLV
ncbi:LysR family transcriptional regulator [Cloacibacillus sp.]|uniref:LysR family transcriptional regulator n=1 Tax=Cloacibacillus sp. TaxID=2049023 RepID=UPI0025BDEFFF|nr:LysR family transcriptional regulator [Cloacibacillus sp.]MCC8057777.1 LysR family transcriptional regulator [Cloacibacillus sp.]